MNPIPPRYPEHWPLFYVLASQELTQVLDFYFSDQCAQDQFHFIKQFPLALQECRTDLICALQVDHVLCVRPDEPLLTDFLLYCSKIIAQADHHHSAEKAVELVCCVLDGIDAFSPLSAPLLLTDLGQRYLGHIRSDWGNIIDAAAHHPVMDIYTLRMNGFFSDPCKPAQQFLASFANETDAENLHQLCHQFKKNHLNALNIHQALALVDGLHFLRSTDQAEETKHMMVDFIQVLVMRHPDIFKFTKRLFDISDGGTEDDGGEYPLPPTPIQPAPRGALVPV